jgi:S1-C subfamily serine protease
VTDPNSFGYRFATKMIGEQTDFVVLRDGAEQHVTVSLQPAPETIPRDTRELVDYSPFEGATVMNLSPAVSEELGMEGIFDGVVIAEVKRGSTADRVGLRPGDIIRGINRQTVETTEMLEGITKKPPRVWQLDIERDGKVSQLILRG